MNSGFKGVLLGVRNVEIAENYITFTLVFKDPEGTVHASVKHSHIFGDDVITQKTRALLEELISWGADQHFESPSTGTAKTRVENVNGIAEALGAPRNPADEPPSSQG